METQLIVTGQFSSVQNFQDGLLVFRSDPDTYDTIIQKTDLTGQLQMETSLPEPCSPVKVTDEAIVVNCETESMILDGNLTAETFSDPIFLLSNAPDGTQWVRVNRSGKPPFWIPPLPIPNPSNWKAQLWKCAGCPIPRLSSTALWASSSFMILVREPALCCSNRPS